MTSGHPGGTKPHPDSKTIGSGRIPDRPQVHPEGASAPPGAPGEHPAVHPEGQPSPTTKPGGTGEVRPVPDPEPIPMTPDGTAAPPPDGRRQGADEAGGVGCQNYAEVRIVLVMRSTALCGVGSGTRCSAGCRELRDSA